MTRPDVSRREFFRHTAVGAATASSAVGTLGASVLARALGPNGRLRVAFIGTGTRGQAHLDTVLRLRGDGLPIEPVAVCDVYRKHREQAADRLSARGIDPIVTGDYRELIDRQDIDAVCISTPDHWHAQATLDALARGKHVYCERPMTHTLDETRAVLAAWRASGRVMQVGVQGTSDARWRAAHDFVRTGGIGKVVQAQTEYFRNSAMGQWRYQGLSRDMTPRNIDWKMFLGTDRGLAPEVPFDRARFAQWRCYSELGSGLLGELFVPQVTRMLSALGGIVPRRVVAGGGIFLELDGRDVPDTATLVADFDAGLQLLVTATMANDHKIEQCIRGHHGTIVFDMSRDGFDVLPQRPQVTRIRDAQKRHVSALRPSDETRAHWENFLTAVVEDNPARCHNTPELGAAAVITVQLGAECYRQGRVLEWDAGENRAIASSSDYARQQSRRSQERAAPSQITGWQPPADNPFFGRQRPEDYQKLAGPWQDGIDPAG
ncbi:MAG: Gfo/Idh/MocA family protein [Pirellulales bacterium]